MHTAQIADGARAIIDKIMNQIANRIVEIVSEATQVSPKDIIGPRRFISIIRARALIAHILATFGFSDGEIALVINRHQSSARHLKEIFDNMYQTEIGFRILADMVIMEIEKETAPSDLPPKSSSNLS